MSFFFQKRNVFLIVSNYCCENKNKTPTTVTKIARISLRQEGNHPVFVSRCLVAKNNTQFRTDVST